MPVYLPWCSQKFIWGTSKFQARPKKVQSAALPLHLLASHTMYVAKDWPKTRSVGAWRHYRQLSSHNDHVLQLLNACHPQRVKESNTISLRTARTSRFLFATSKWKNKKITRLQLYRAQECFIKPSQKVMPSPDIPPHNGTRTTSGEEQGLNRKSGEKAENGPTFKGW